MTVKEMGAAEYLLGNEMRVYYDGDADVNQIKDYEDGLLYEG